MRQRMAKIAGIMIVALPCLIHAQEYGSSVQQNITVEVKPITSIVVSGNPSQLTIVDPPAGENAYATVVDRSTSYSVVTNLDRMKIVASISDPMPVGTRLMIALGSSKGKSTGIIDISTATSPQTAIEGLGRGADKSQPISYIFAANAIAGEIESGSRVVTLTVTE